MPLLIITLWLKFQIGSKKQYFASRDCYAKFFGTWIKMIFATVIGTICHIDFARVLIYCVGVTYHETAYWMVAMILFMQTRDLDSACFSFCTHVVNVART